MKTVRGTVLSIPVATTAWSFPSSLSVSHSDHAVVTTETVTWWKKTWICWSKCSFPSLFSLSGDFYEATKWEMLQVSKSCSNQIAETSRRPCLTPKSIRLSLNFSWETPPPLPPPPVSPTGSWAVLSDGQYELEVPINLTLCHSHVI